MSSLLMRGSVAPSRGGTSGDDDPVGQTGVIVGRSKRPPRRGRRGARIDPLADGAGATMRGRIVFNGNMDGDVGPKSKAALTALKLAELSPEEQFSSLEALLQKQFPDEYFDRVPDAGVIQ